MKQIEDYLNLPYTREILLEPEGGWFIRIKELPGCMSQGETVEEAMTMINDALAGWLTAAIRNGKDIPQPQSKEL